MMEATVTTFAARCTGLRTHIGRIKSSDEDKHLVRTMETIRAELADHVSRIASLTKAMGVFAAEGMPRPAIDAPGIRGLKTKVSSLTRKLDSNRSKIANDNGWAECAVKAKALADKLDIDLRKLWSDFIVSERPGYEMFNAFRGLPQCGPPLRELERLASILNGQKGTLPQDPAPVALVRSTVARMREQIGSLGLDGEPEAMIAFLKKCSAEGGAPLSDLTPEIFQWIVQKGFAADLRVKPR